MKYVVPLLLSLAIFSGCLHTSPAFSDERLTVCASKTAALSRDCPTKDITYVKWKRFPLYINEISMRQRIMSKPTPEVAEAEFLINSHRNLLSSMAVKDPDILVVHDYTDTAWFPTGESVAVTVHTNFHHKLHAVIFVATSKITNNTFKTKVIAHELLHAIGLNHTNTPGSILNAKVAEDSILSKRTIELLKSL